MDIIKTDDVYSVTETKTVTYDFNVGWYADLMVEALTDKIIAIQDDDYYALSVEQQKELITRIFEKALSNLREEN